MTEDDQVRRLLADARHTDPIPPDVADRLDGVLADLRADRPVPSDVGDLAAARRRRRVRTLLVAAAVVVVAGLGIDYAREIGTSSGGADSASSGAAADSGDAPSAGRVEVLEDGALTNGQDFAGAERLDPERFAAQARQLRPTAQDGVEFPAAGSQAAACAVPGRGRLVAVRYEGSPAVLVYRPVEGDSQVVDLYRCGVAEPLRSTTLAAPGRD